MTAKSAERRSDNRCDFVNRIVYILSDKHDYALFKGVTINMSEAGMCFYTFNPVRRDEEVLIVKSILPVESQIGTVRWTKKMPSDFFKVGLMFRKESILMDGRKQ